MSQKKPPRKLPEKYQTVLDKLNQVKIPARCPPKQYSALKDRVETILRPVQKELVYHGADKYKNYNHNVLHAKPLQHYIALFGCKLNDLEARPKTRERNKEMNHYISQKNKYESKLEVYQAFIRRQRK